MDPHAHYALGCLASKATVTLRKLSDQRIAHYKRRGYYRERRGAWTTTGNRLVYSC